MRGAPKQPCAPLLGPTVPPPHVPVPCCSPPPCGPRGRCARDAGTAGPPSGQRPLSAAPHAPRQAGAAATARSAGAGTGVLGTGARSRLQPHVSPCPQRLTSIHSDTSSIRRLEKVSFRYILSPAAAPAKGPSELAFSEEAPRKRAKSQRAPASASCRGERRWGPDRGQPSRELQAHRSWHCSAQGGNVTVGLGSGSPSPSAPGQRRWRQ